MLRLFSIFPAGGPGVALALLRASVSIEALYCASTRATTPAYPALFWTACVAVVALCVGLWTPLAEATVFSIQVVCLITEGLQADLITAAVNSVALSLLGPGAYSVDARLFGRRVIALSDYERPGEPRRPL